MKRSKNNQVNTNGISSFYKKKRTIIESSSDEEFQNKDLNIEPELEDKQNSFTKIKTENSANNDVNHENDKDVNEEIKQVATSGYGSYMRREPPKNLGSKPIPKGKSNCLNGLAFVITGELESFDRDTIKEFIQRYGGIIRSAISSKTSYVVVGREPGPAKMKKVKLLKISTLNEDQLVDLIEKINPVSTQHNSPVMNVINVKENNPIKRKSTIKQIPAKKPKIEESTDTTTNILWTDKYRPTKMNKLVGQHGPKSAANQLSEWLGQWRDQDTNDIPGAALLSGLPGLGKTTSALIVSKEMGFSPIELNASDKRSKKMLESGLAVSISNKTITSFFKKKEKRQELDKNAIIIMDEVDGMAGNEDRGGVSLLIDLIKKTTIPIICICNDASLPKMRSLSKYCLHLKFNRYRVEQIKAHLMSICFKENVSVESNALTNMIEKSDRDIRQCINNLQIMASQNKKLDFDLMYKYSNDSKKPTKLNAFDIARYYITPMGSNANSIKIKLEHFFNEYDVVPLMVQENYIKVISSNRSMSKLEALSKAANSMAVGDMIFNQIRSMNRWNLLPEYGFAGAYYPGELIRGQLEFMDLRFPQWFGKNSSRNKNMRLIQQIIKHSCLKCDSFTISSSPDSLFYYYLIIKKCLNNDFEEFFNFMQEYAFSREDVETILDIASITSSFKMDTKTKRTLTKKLKSVSRNLPYSTSEDVKKSKKTKLVKSEPETESEPESEDIEYDEY